MSQSLWEEEEIDLSLKRFAGSFGHEVEAEVMTMDEESPQAAKLSEKSEAELKLWLLCAIWKEKRDWVRFLLAQGADPNGRDGGGRTCLHLAASKGNLELSQMLLDYGAKVDAFDDHRRATPLFCAAVSQGTELVRRLVENGAAVNAGLHELGYTDLHCAVRANRVENAMELLTTRNDLLSQTFKTQRRHGRGKV